LGERTFTYTLGSALLRKLVFQKEGVIPESPISDLERVQGLFSSMITGIGKDTLKIDTWDTRTVNKIAKRMDSMELMRKLFDDVKEAKITELKKKERENAFNYFLVRWILAQGLATPEELALALGAGFLEPIIVSLGSEDVTTQKKAEKILSGLAETKIFSGNNAELLKNSRLKIEETDGKINITIEKQGTESPDGRGRDGKAIRGDAGPAMRWSGQGLTEDQEKVVDDAVREYFTEASKIAQRTQLNPESSEYKTLDPEGLLAREAKMAVFGMPIKKRQAKIFFLPGLVDRIKELAAERGVEAPDDLVAHPGRTRSQIYLDPNVYAEIASKDEN